MLRGVARRTANLVLRPALRASAENRDELRTRFDGVDARLRAIETRLEHLVDALAGRGDALTTATWDGVAAVRGDLVEVRKRLRYLALDAILRDPVLDGKDLVRFESSFSSQNGEDGVLHEILRRVGSGERRFVEIGAHAAESNCAFLADVLGWRGVLIDADATEAERIRRKYQGGDAVTAVCALVTPDDIDERLGEHGPHVLSIDVDGNDYWLWRAMRSCRPAVVIVEYNSACRADVPLVQAYTEAPFDNTEQYGASLAAMLQLAHSKGYTLVHAEVSGTNLFFVRADLVQDRFVDESALVQRATNYHLAAQLHAPADGGREMITPPAED